MTSASQPNRKRAKEASGDAAAGVGRPPGWNVWLVCIGVTIGTLAVYAQIREFSFVDWDDNLFFRDNPHAWSGLTWENFAWSLRIHGPGQWHPLAWWIHQLNCELFGLDAGGHHVVNVLLHVAAALALLAAFWRLTGDFWPSALVAVLFALHPLSVESVAWASHLRDPLSTVFWALVMWSYAGFARRGGARRYALVLVLFALGLMSKPTLITLPCVLLLLDYWPLRRIAEFEGAAPAPEGAGARCPPQRLGRVLLEKAPLIALSGISAWLCYLCQLSQGAVVSLEIFSLGERLANTAQSYALHVWKVVWPVKLSHIYPFRTSFHPLAVAGAVVFLLLVTAAVVWSGRRRRHLLVGWLWFLGTLAPAIGLLKMGAATSMTDHHGYVSRLGIYLAIAWSLAGLLERHPAMRRAVAVGVAAVLLVLMPLSWRQAGVWRDTLSLNEHALSVTKDNALAQQNMGDALHRSGRPQEAIAHYEEAVRIRPAYVEAQYNWGNALQELGRYEEAVAHYEEAVRIRPDSAQAQYNWGNALQELGRHEEAVAHYEEAVRIRPDYVQAQYNWGFALQDLGRHEEAIAHYEEALRIQPYFAGAHFSRGNALMALGRPQDAIAHYAEALRIQPGFADAHNNWGYALQQLRRHKEAVAHHEEALRIRPDHAEAHRNLARMLASSSDDALRDGERALEHARRFVELVGENNAIALAALAAAYAEAGKFDEAVSWQDKALRIAGRSMKEEFTSRLERYRQGLPYRQSD